MVTSNDCLKKYGDPYKERNMVVFQIPTYIKKECKALPTKIYCNKDLVGPLTDALDKLADRGLLDQIKSWDGCFSIRQIRGGNGFSLHSWGIAIDINANENPLGVKPKLSHQVVECFTSSGFQWGGVWERPDGMHFQLAEI